MKILTALGLALVPFIVTAIIYWIVKTWEAKGGIGIAVVIFILAFIFFYSIADANAESAIVAFDNAEQLAALTDSVVGVCDTIPGYWMYEDTVYNYKIYVAEIGKDIELDYAYVDSDSTDEYPYWVGRIITCRRLVGVTVTKFSIKLRHYQAILDPGKAIIFYEETE